MAEARRPRTRSAALVLAAAVGLVAWAEAAALRCVGDLVTEGDYAYEVRRVCGEPAAIQPLDDPAHHDHGPSEEIWYYDLGDNRLLRALHFLEGRLRRIEVTDRATGSGEGDGRCRPAEIVAGMSSYRLLQACGEPAQRERRHVRRQAFPQGQSGLVHDVLVEQWFYEFGPNRFDRRVRLEDGEVVDVETLN